jgi:hypothetical protein
METEEQLSIISKAWGRQKGYCFFPYIRGDAKDKKERIMSYEEGKAFLWPRDRDKIIAHLNAHKNDDVYWCPSLFEGPKRRLELAMDEHALWADLDEVDPRQIEDYPPTIAWETSPGRFQALWLISGGDMQGASWAGRENQCLTYHLGADPSGWDTTQLLRIPGWANHKPDYRKKDGSAPVGKLITQRGRRYLVDEFNDLPDVPTANVVVEILEDEIDRVDRQSVWGRVRLKVSQRVRELVSARSATGDRSDALWEIERELADAGCTVPEIVAIVRATVWNKFQGRGDEIRRLTTEAAKAVAMRGGSGSDPDSLEPADTVERPLPTNLFLLVKDLPPPTWLVRDVLTKGAVGFIAGQPKSYKSWVALDLGLSVASGQPFLGHFAIEDPGPVLYVQEEDSGPMVKRRLNKIWPGKLGDKLELSKDGSINWLPAQENTELPPINGYIGNGFTISDPGWQVWLDETLEAGVDGVKYKLMIFDPLMMMAGEVEENRAQQMTEYVFKPLKQLARKHECAIQVVHHMKKGDPRTPMRGGQLLLGSVANHAWAEDSMYFRIGKGGVIVCEQESKQAPVPGFQISHIRNRKWEPVVTVNRGDTDDESEATTNGRLDDSEGPVRKARETGNTRTRSTPPGRPNRVLAAMHGLAEPIGATDLAHKAGVGAAGAHKVLQRAIGNGLVLKIGQRYTLTNEGKKAARAESERVA